MPPQQSNRLLSGFGDIFNFCTHREIKEPQSIRVPSLNARKSDVKKKHGCRLIDTAKAGADSLFNIWRGHKDIRAAQTVTGDGL